MMSTFLPSEISRLNYGYLSTHCGQKLADEFSKACPSMEESRQMKRKYRNFHTTVQDLTLETILDQYSKLCSTIFACFDENKREHRNVLNLLEMILKKHQREQSTSNGQISDMPRMSKEITNSPLQLTDRKNSVINELVSNLSKVSPDSRNASQTIDAGISSNLLEDQLAMNISNSRSNEISSHYKSQKSIPHLNRSVLETGQSVDSDLFTSPEGTDQHHISETVHSFMLEEVEAGLRENTESVSLEEPILTERNIEFDSANNETGQSSGIESSSGKMNQRNPRTTFHSLALTEAENPEFCSSQRGFYETQSATSARVDESCRGDEQTKTSSAEIEGNAIPLSESAENIPSSCSVPLSSIQADWKAIFCNSVKMSTPSKNEKMQTSRKTTSKSTGTPHKIKKANSSETSIQVLFENLSKNFKHRPHPYLSSAKSSRLLHQATLSPLSKM
ncbi:hypothetical protein V9T40_002937 [Parthenolecanium corni]|uniref:Uncharacterized protein n=1 Tax=Parthenolecanium corni TaxID=536013 RepID=A0AAN9TJA6_9HEMI